MNKAHQTRTVFLRWNEPLKFHLGRMGVTRQLGCWYKLVTVTFRPKHDYVTVTSYTNVITCRTVFAADTDQLRAFYKTLVGKGYAIGVRSENTVTLEKFLTLPNTHPDNPLRGRWWSAPSL